MGDYPHLDFVFSTVTAVVQSPLGPLIFFCRKSANLSIIVQFSQGKTGGKIPLALKCLYAFCLVFHNNFSSTVK